MIIVEFLIKIPDIKHKVKLRYKYDKERENMYQIQKEDDT